MYETKNARFADSEGDRLDTKEMLTAALTKISDQVKAAGAESREKLQEHGARLLEIEQKVLRRAGNGGDLGGGSYHQAGAFSAAADDLLAGIKAANSSKVSLAISIKAALSDVNHTLGAQPLGAVSVYSPAIARLVDLLPSRPVTANTVTYVRIGYGPISDSPPAGNKAAKVAELAAKPESSVEAVPVSVEIPTWAHWIETSKQILDDVSELKAILDGILRGGLLDKIDLGVYAMMTTGGNYTSFSPVSGETVGDGVARIAAQIATAGGSNIIVALNPADFLTMQLTKADTSGNYLGIPPNLASRVVSAPAVTASKILAFAPGSGAGWADREGVNVTLGLSGDQFQRNAVTVLCEARGETMIRNPAHVAYGNATAA